MILLKRAIRRRFLSNSSGGGLKNEIERVKQMFGITGGFRELQEEAITAAVKGKRVFVTLPTGMGKSLIFQIPSCIRKPFREGANDGLTIVISPLIALISDQVFQAKKFLGDDKVAALNSTVNYKEQTAIMNNLDKLDLLFVTAERILNDDFRNALLQKQLPARFVFDEAHCITEWGNHFRPAYITACNLISDEFKHVPWTAVTATIVKKDMDKILSLLSKPQDALILKASSFTRKNLTYEIRKKTKEDKLYDDIVNDLRDCECALVYCYSKEDTEKLSEHLTLNGISSNTYHGGKNKGKRSVAQDLWMQGIVKVMVATTAFGMGINKPNVRKVIHATLPLSISAYSQQTGRGGRDGLPTQCVLYFSERDVKKNEYLLGSAVDTDRFFFKKSSYDMVNEMKKELDMMANMCRHHETKCVKHGIVTYFGSIPKVQALDTVWAEGIEYDFTCDKPQSICCAFQPSSSSSLHHQQQKKKKLHPEEEQQQDENDDDQVVEEKHHQPPLLSRRTLAKSPLLNNFRGKKMKTQEQEENNVLEKKKEKKITKQREKEEDKPKGAEHYFDLFWKQTQNDKLRPQAKLIFKKAFKTERIQSVEDLRLLKEWTNDMIEKYGQKLMDYKEKSKM